MTAPYPYLVHANGEPFKCSFCEQPAKAIFNNRTDGRNGLVCEDHFCESNLLKEDPQDAPWANTPIIGEVSK